MIYVLVLLAGLVSADSLMASQVDTPNDNRSRASKMSTQVKENELKAQKSELATLERKMQTKGVLSAEELKKYQALTTKILNNTEDINQLAKKADSLSTPQERDQAMRNKAKADMEAAQKKSDPIDELLRRSKDLSTPKFEVNKGKR